MQSPKTWGEMQSLAGKLAELNHFLSRSTNRSLPFFETLKDITKENKDDYRWTKKGEKHLLRTQKYDPGPTAPYDSTSEGNLVYIPSDIRGSSQCSSTDSKERKAISGALHQPIKQILSKADTSGKLE
ncbi:hypothetical protein Tco_1297337 [Tanacetum coccineum]